MRNIFFRLLAFVLVLAAIGGIAFLAYNAGVTHGQAITAQLPAGQSGSQANPVYAVPYWFPFPFFGFGFFGFVAVFFLFFVIFGALRFALWGPRYGWHRMGRRYGPWGEGNSNQDIPPMMAELHRRMHAADEAKSPDQPTQN